MVMIIRQRAIQIEDKRERYQAILNAAERVLMRSPDQSANVAEVAEAAGLAKGTVYLYFQSKEELLLALHERNVEGLFSELIARLENPALVGIDDILALTHQHLIDPPLALPLAVRCLSNMGQSISVESEVAFKRRLAERLSRAGAGLERHFPELGPGGGVALLHHSYALILGSWQLSGAEQRLPAPGIQSLPAFSWNYAESVGSALRALWRGTTGADTARNPTPGNAS
jgi:AcrR family transcriptional regulator